MPDSATTEAFNAKTDGPLGPDAIYARFTPGQHRVIFYQIDETGGHVFDADGAVVISRVVETCDLETVQRLYRETVLNTRSHSSASISLSSERFDSLPAYIRALNIAVRLSDDLPKDGAWIGALTEDLEKWAEIGVSTPAHLDSFLTDCFQIEMKKGSRAG